jgi:hypothetical protein
VVAAPRRRAEVVLLKVHHLMHQRGQCLLRRALMEVPWVERDLVGDLAAIGRAEALTSEVARRRQNDVR